MKNQEAIQTRILKMVVNGNLSFTTIGAGIAIVTAWVLYSTSSLVEPGILVWVGIIITGAGIGVCADTLQSYFGKYI